MMRIAFPTKTNTITLLIDGLKTPTRGSVDFNKRSKQHNLLKTSLVD